MNGAQLTLGFGSHRSELKASCSRLLGSPVEAEDAVQETLLRAWRAADRFEGRATVRSWLYRIAKNVCIDAANRRSREPMPIEEWDRSDQGAEPDPAEIAL